ncbi:MAG TPA: hypothetical protein VFA18_09725, partial [Gemmataceae bacterium]|nr:hypothetical protein [Gemmataceae bacterium]
PRLAGPEHTVELYADGRLAALVHGTGTWAVNDGLYSPAYGVVQQTPTLVLEFTGPTCHWSFRGGR